MGRGDRKMAGTYWPAGLAQSVSYGFSERLCLKNKVWSGSGPYMYAESCAHAHICTQNTHVCVYIHERKNSLNKSEDRNFQRLIIFIFKLLVFHEENEQKTTFIKNKQMKVILDSHYQDTYISFINLV